MDLGLVFFVCNAVILLFWFGVIKAVWNIFSDGLSSLLGFALIGDLFQRLFLVQVADGDGIEEFVAADKAVDQVFVEMEDVVPQFV